MKARFIKLSSITALGVLGCYAVEESHTNDLLPLEREIESTLPEGASILWKVSPTSDRPRSRASPGRCATEVVCSSPTTVTARTSRPGFHPRST